MSLMNCHISKFRSGFCYIITAVILRSRLNVLFQTPKSSSEQVLQQEICRSTLISPLNLPIKNLLHMILKCNILEIRIQVLSVQVP